MNVGGRSAALARVGALVRHSSTVVLSSRKYSRARSVYPSSLSVPPSIRYCFLQLWLSTVSGLTGKFEKKGRKEKHIAQIQCRFLVQSAGEYADKLSTCSVKVSTTTQGESAITAERTRESKAASPRIHTHTHTQSKTTSEDGSERNHTI